MSNTPKNLYGYGTSVLSIRNKKNAMDEELLGDKDIGLVGIYHIKDEDNGYISSALYTSRVKKHLNEFMDKCIKDNTIGNIYKININDELVKIVPNSMNLFDNTLTFTLYDKPNSFRFGIDFDYFNKLNNTSFKAHDIKIRISFTLTKNSESKNYYIEETAEQINKKAFKFDFSTFIDQNDIATYKLTLNTMEITLPVGYDNTTNVFVIYDILTAIV